MTLFIRQTLIFEGETAKEFHNYQQKLVAQDAEGRSAADLASHSEPRHADGAVCPSGQNSRQMMGRLSKSCCLVAFL